MSNVSNKRVECFLYNWTGSKLRLCIWNIWTVCYWVLLRPRHLESQTLKVYINADEQNDSLWKGKLLCKSHLYKAF